MSDTKLKEQTAVLKKRLGKETLDAILPDAPAACEDDPFSERSPLVKGNVAIVETVEDPRFTEDDNDRQHLSEEQQGSREFGVLPIIETESTHDELVAAARASENEMFRKGRLWDPLDDIGRHNRKGGNAGKHKRQS